jgi:hypothetical protein
MTKHVWQLHLINLRVRPFKSNKLNLNLKMGKCNQILSNDSDDSSETENVVIQNE